MPIQTNLKAAPYFDDYDPNKDYYKILFQPGVPVQVRELNQLQTMLQKQIERFGDNVLKRGTIVDGCEPTFYPDIDFVKLKDTQAGTSAAINVSNYVGLYARNPAGLIAEIIDVASGFEGTDPNLNTLYLRYINYTGNTAANNYSVVYDNDQVLTLFNKDKRVHSVRINTTSTGFLSSDLVVIYPAIEVQNTAGGTTFTDAFTPGETLVFAGSETVEIVSVNATANSTALVIQVKPTDSALSTTNTANWNLATGSSLIHSANGQEVVLTGFVGAGASANVVLTQGATEISSISMRTYGRGYYVAPTVSVASNTAGIVSIGVLDATALLYEAQVQVANTLVAPLGNIIGTAYGMSINDGVVYQKGYFQRVAPQFTIIEKYSNTPNEVAVGFSTVESIVNYREDSSLVDNAAGFLNANAPGANRLKLTPVLTAKTEAAAAEDTEFFSIFKFADGKVWSQSTKTEYSKIRDEMALRTFEESGNYVLDKFEMSTRSTFDIANSDTHFTYLIDPGHAYVNGYRLKTDNEYVKYVEKALATKFVANAAFDLVYGNYVRVNELAGILNYTTAEYVVLSDAPGNYLTNNPTSSITNPGVTIGNARVRSIVHESGTPGTPGAVYRIYLFDIKMSKGKNFRDVRSIVSVGNGIADPILEPAPGVSSTPICKLYSPEKNSLLIDTKLPLSVANNVSYRYRTIKDDVLYPGTGSEATIIVNDDPAADIQLPYSGALTTEEKEEVIIIPQANVVSTSNIAGSATGSSGTLTGSSTDFVNELRAGDYVYADGKIVRIDSIASSVLATYTPSTESITAGANVALAFPANIPIDLNRSGRAATSTGSALTITLGSTFVVGGNTDVKVMVNEEFVNSDPITKTVTRTAFVLIQANTHVNGVNGPWCLGVPDVFRLNAVYAGSNTGATDITEHFYVEDGQRENYYDLAFLVKDPQSTYTIGADDELLVEYSVTTHAAGIKTVTSYTLNDETRLANLVSEMHTLEIPEFKDTAYHDLRECFDFRPLVSNTVAIATVEGSAPVNPKQYGPTANSSHVANSDKFSGSGRKFPLPEGDLFIDYTQYRPRVDTVKINSAGEFEFLLGENKSTGAANEMLLYKSYVPPYPSLAQSLSKDMNDILNKRMWSQGATMTQRRDNYTVTINSIEEQTPGYTMKAIHEMNARIKLLEQRECCVKEAEVKEKVIPSSQDPKINRYKFGFFIDEFENIALTDVANRSNKSNIYNGKLYPKTTQYDIKLRLASKDGDKLASRLMFPYDDVVLFEQKIATDGPVIIPAESTPPAPAPVISPATTEEATTPTAPVANTTANTVTDAPKITENSLFVISPDSYIYSREVDTVHTQQFILSSNTQADNYAVKLYFYNLSSRGDAIRIYQSTTASFDSPTVIVDTTITDNASPVSALTAAEIRELRNLGLTYPGRTPYRTWNSTALPTNDGVTGYLLNNGKITFNYNQDNGRYFKVDFLKKGSSGSRFAYYITYPGDQVVNTVTTPVIDQTVDEPKPIIYTTPEEPVLRPVLRNEPTLQLDTAYLSYKTYIKKTYRTGEDPRVSGGLAKIKWNLVNALGGDYKIFYKNIDITKWCVVKQNTATGTLITRKPLGNDIAEWDNNYGVEIEFYPSELILLGIFDQEQYTAIKSSLPYTTYDAVSSPSVLYAGTTTLKKTFSLDISIISASSPVLSNLSAVEVVPGVGVQYLSDFNGFGSPKSTGSNIDRRILTTADDFVDVINGRLVNEDKIVDLIESVYAARGSRASNPDLYNETYRKIQAAVALSIITPSHADNLNKILRG